MKELFEQLELGEVPSFSVPTVVIDRQPDRQPWRCQALTQKGTRCRNKATMPGRKCKTHYHKEDQ